MQLLGSCREGRQGSGGSGAPGSKATLCKKRLGLLPAHTSITVSPSSSGWRGWKLREEAKGPSIPQAACTSPARALGGHCQRAPLEPLTDTSSRLLLHARGSSKPGGCGGSQGPALRPPKLQPLNRMPPHQHPHSQPAPHLSLNVAAGAPRRPARLQTGRLREPPRSCPALHAPGGRAGGRARGPGLLLAPSRAPGLGCESRDGQSGGGGVTWARSRDRACARARARAGARPRREARELRAG